MKKICFFSGDITRCGGTERVSTIIANGIVRKGKYQVIFLSLVEQNDFPLFTISPEIKKYVLRKDGNWIQPGVGYLPLIPVLRRFLKKEEIDILIDIDIVLDVLSIPASAGMRVKIISWEHFHYYYEQDFLYRKIIARFSAYFSDYMITLTKQDKENYKRELHRNNKIDCIYNPIEISEATAVLDDSTDTLREYMLITVGSLNERKGTDMIAKIVPVILEKHKEWKWYFLGDGEYRTILEETIHCCQLEGRLILTGNVSNVEDYLRRASVFVMPSRLEGLPMCLLEAKACQLPCVAFDIQTGPSEIIQNEKNGFLISPFDLEAMTEKINLLIENENLRNQFSENAVVEIEKFELNSILQQWEQVLEAV